MRLLVSILWSIALAGVGWFNGADAADERILSYDVELVVQLDGSVDVTERIEVRVEGNRIKRGIFRDIPTDYEGPYGTNVRVSLDVLSVYMDGMDIPWRDQKLDYGRRIRIGDPNRMLSRDVHTFLIRYNTNRQLLYFDDRDELYWNVTGNGWDFIIDKATAKVTLPNGVTISDITGYTGARGSTAKNYKITQNNGRAVKFETVGRLAPREGLTVAVTWPAGVVYRPSMMHKITYFFKDNFAAFIGLLGSIVLYYYFYYMWSQYGRDPKGGTIIPRYDPPKGLSPATCRYILKMGYSSAAVSAAIVSLAVKGCLTIDEKGKTVTLTKVGEGVDLSKPEAALARDLFHYRKTVELGDEYSKSFAVSIGVFKDALKANEVKYFARNIGANVGGIAIAFLVTLSGLLFAATMSPIYFIFVALNLVISGVFIYLMKAPTEFGRQIMDEIEGFKMYLGKAEKDRLNFHNPPEKTPELFEKYLPFAIALDVENEWGDQFDDVLARAAAFSGEEGYHPAWYYGSRRRGRFSSRSFSHGLSSSLSSSISTSTTAPSSSGGGFSGGGGGFSGGGGGGGGGGGW